MLFTPYVHPTPYVGYPLRTGGNRKSNTHFKTARQGSNKAG